MTPPTFPEIDHPAVAPVCFAYSAAQCIIALRHGDQMDVVWHQAVGPDFNRTFPAPFGQKGNVRPVIIITEEGLHPSVAPLGNMVRDAGGYDTCDSGHVWRLMEALSQGKM